MTAIVAMTTPIGCASKAVRITNSPAPLPIKKVVVKMDHLELREAIYFETEEARIKSVSFRVLDEVASTLQDHPEIVVLRIEGHTDNRGPDRYNDKLSRERAEAVRQYLVDQGIESGRLRSKGYGAKKPLDMSDSPAAWERNRRVEMFIAKRRSPSA